MLTQRERRERNELETELFGPEPPPMVNDYEPTSPEDVEEPPEKIPRREEVTTFSSSSARASSSAIPGREVPTADNLMSINYMIEEEDKHWKILQAAIADDNEVFTIELDLDLESNRSKKAFMNNPSAFLVKKMRDSEVVFGKLSKEHQVLFNRAKAKEVSSFVQNQAVRKCLDDQEIKEALGSGRVLRARWVLVWKLVPPEDRADAKKDAAENSKTVHTREGDRKAKARIVLLGYEHPELGSTDYKTSSPVQSVLARNLLYQMVCQHDWLLEGLDLATAFLQTKPTSADAKLHVDHRCC